MSHTSAQTTSTRVKSALQKAALTLGAIFLLLGILGFIPGITTNYDAMKFAGHTSDAKLFGLFQVSVLHNIIHLLLGVAGLAMAKTSSLAKAFLIGGGVISLIMWLYGLFVGPTSGANFVPFNAADNWLHLVLGVVMIGLGALLGRQHTPARTSRGRAV
ncbi:DUF4383 domain-containing protein [Actinomadura craniellae]|uniref:DUF4383 domain-containing protein n=1 Tax=Actinomadura craniellae TaxID=2231787 RepID=A0A365HAG4_9ACTN|nr:DUF4383 domain-containing protein [Actinomadura craniellae]RAY16085.1 DUF4383 domain-containing protein [Actinomadura craniellae]